VADGARTHDTWLGKPDAGGRRRYDMKIPHLESKAVPIALDDDALLGVGVDVVSLVAWSVDNGEERFVRIDARNHRDEIVLGIPLTASAAATLADQLREAADETDSKT
jgi:hypothetical protein